MNTIETVDIKKIKPNPDNPRFIKDESFKKLVKSLQEFPEMIDARPIVVNMDWVILGGNMRYRALREIGATETKVMRVDWSEDKQKEFVIKDNVSGGEWDWDLLANEWNIDNLSDWGLDLPNDWAVDTEVVEDEAPEVADKPVSELGKIYQLGNHRVMCGDSTDEKQVAELMDGNKADMVFTDPPYGMDLDTDYTKMGDGGKKHDAVIADNQQFDARPLLDMFDYCKEIFLWGADYYVETMDRQYPELGSWIIWDKYSDKDRTGLLDGRFGSTFETCWSKTPHKREIARVLVTTNYTARGDESRVHPTQKPVELATWFFNKWGKKHGTVVDLYLGSGSTLIACEQTDRICYGMELDPKYVDVIRKRWAKFVYPDTWEERWQELTPEVI